MIEVKNISKSFGRTRVLSDVSFKVGNGEVVGYVGLNGAGKTTTIRIIVGVLNPDSGDVIVDGYSVLSDKRRASERIGWVPELPIFETEFKALDYFVYLAGYHGLSKSEAVKLGKELLGRMGLEDAMGKRLSEYSQGMKKRFALAVSLISNPPNIVFDEVLNGLDPQGIAFFRELAREFKRENKAVLFSSHILKEVEQLADKVVFIHKGRIIGVYTMEEITRLAKPSLKIRVSNNLEEAVKILSNYGEVVAGDMEITVKINHGVNPEEILGELVKRSIGVKEFRNEERDLEAFFFELIREAEKQ
ncbi:MAG: ABC transporter ATP-binding protein [Desulfurococcus sp.]|uniref:ABC transporter ATP-binding protein n=1 Tax=Desulfurococcus sp. TaxID=51678 RepID=UPI003163DEB5